MKKQTTTTTPDFRTLVGEGATNCPQLMELIEQAGFLPLLDSGIAGFSADEAVRPDCRYTRLPDGGWDWPLWDWKGPIVTEGHFAYGKFFAGKAGFVSPRWWPDFCNHRRALYPEPTGESVEAAILDVLRTCGSMITRDLRAACGFTGPKMRSRFDAYVARLQAACRVVTEDFVYPRDAHDKPYGWGWALLTVPESLFGHDACHPTCSAADSRDRIAAHFAALLPDATPRQLAKLIDGR